MNTFGAVALWRSISAVSPDRLGHGSSNLASALLTIPASGRASAAAHPGSESRERRAERVWCLGGMGDCGHVCSSFWRCSAVQETQKSM